MNWSLSWEPQDPKSMGVLVWGSWRIVLPTLKLSSFENFLLSSPCMEELLFPPICSTVQPCVLGYCCFIVQSLNRVQFFVTSRTAACWASLSMQFSRQEYWSGLPFLPPGDLPDPGIEPESSALPALQADSTCWAIGELANRRGKDRSSDRFYFLGLQNHRGQWLYPGN